jgi:hypothetical protein
MKLSEYLNDTAELMSDPTYSFTSQFQMTRWINEARRLLAMRTGCIRRLIAGQSAFGAGDQAGIAIPGGVQPGAVPQAFNYGLGGPVGTLSGTSGGGFSFGFSSGFDVGGVGYGSASAAPVAGATLGPMMTIQGVERYPFVGFFNNYLRQQHAGCDKVNDVISLAVSWGGVSKPTLFWMPWDEFQAYCRAYALLNTAYPAVWSVMNDGTQGEVWLFPIPSQANDLEADVTCLPINLNSDNDFDAIPESFSDAVKFGAAVLCYLATNRPGQADIMIQQGGGYVLTQRAAVDRGKTPNYYGRM